MKFKQYKLILESEQKKDNDPHPLFKDMSHYRKEIENVDDVVKLIKEKCDVKNYLYRGFEDDGDYYIIDGSKGERVSKNTTNYYTLILDQIFATGSAYKNYPLRSKSIICSTSKKTASHYGNVYVVLPFKGVDIGYIGSDDIWNSDIEIGEMNFKLPAWNRIFEGMGVSDDGYYDILNILVREHRDGLETIKEIVEDYYHSDDEDEDYDEDYVASEHDIESYIDGYAEFSFHDIESIVSALEDDHRMTGYMLTAKMFGYKELSRDEIEKIIRNAYDPYDLGFELIKTERLNQHTNHEDVECWFGDKCVAVSIDKWDEIKKMI